MNNQNYLPIENETSYVRDIQSSAILNTDLNVLREYKQKRKQSKQILSMQDEINMLKAEIEQIKNHLKLS